MDRHECKCVVYFPKVNWKDGPTEQPSLQAESVRQMYKELGNGQLYRVGHQLPKTGEPRKSCKLSVKDLADWKL